MSHHLVIDGHILAFVANAHQHPLYTALLKHVQIFRLQSSILVGDGDEGAVAPLAQFALRLLDEVHEKRSHHLGDDDADMT